MSWAVNDVFAGLDEFLLLIGKYAPPDYFRGLSACIGRKAMKGSSHIVERKHSVLLFNILYNGFPMLVIVEFCTQHLKREDKTAGFCSHLVYELYFTASDFIAIIQETCQYLSAKSEFFIFTLENRTKLSLFHIVLEFHPNRIIGVVEKYGGSLLAVFNRNFFSDIVAQDNR